IDNIIREMQMDTRKKYLRLELALVTIPALPTRFRDAEFDFYQRTLAGVREQPARAKQCTDLTNRDLGEAVGRQYAQKYFPAASKRKVLEMVGRIRLAFHNDIEQSTWMDAT